MRERRPGVWEIRIAVGRDPVTGTPRQRSFTVHGPRTEAQAHRLRLFEEMAGARLPSARYLTVAELLPAWLEADQPWKPSTLVGYRSVVRFLLTDPLAQTRAAGLTPYTVRGAIARWNDAGDGQAVVGGRVRVLRSALSWAWGERILAVHPLRGMRGPARPEPRRPLDDHAIGALLSAAEVRLLEAYANHPPGEEGRSHQRTAHALHRAEQDLLLVRLAADSGARRGELAALRIDDLDDRLLHIARAVSAGQIATPKSGRGRTITLGGHTASLWHQLVEAWTARCPDSAQPEVFGPWLFTSDASHQRRLGAEVLGNRFTRLRDAAGVPGATLHRFRHSVATRLVRDGKILDAQARLGHADAATTLREYSYAQPGTDTEIADHTDAYLDRCKFDESGESLPLVVQGDISEDAPGPSRPE